MQRENERDRALWAAMAWAQANPEKLHEMATQKDAPGRPGAQDESMREDYWWAALPPMPPPMDIPVQLKAVANE